GLRDESLDKLKHAVGPVDEAVEELMRIDRSLAGSPLVEPAFGTRGLFAWRQPEKGQVVRTLEMRSRLLELRSALGVDEVRDRVRKPTLRIALCRNAACLDENRPAGTESAQRIVKPRGGADELGRGCRVEIGAAEPGRALEAAILVEDYARRDERRPGQEIGKHSGLFAILREVQHGKRLTRRDAMDSGGVGARRRRTARRALRPRPPPCARSPTTRGQRSTGEVPIRRQPLECL